MSRLPQRSKRTRPVIGSCFGYRPGHRLDAARADARCSAGRKQPIPAFNALGVFADKQRETPTLRRGPRHAPLRELVTRPSPRWQSLGVDFLSRDWSNLGALTGPLVALAFRTLRGRFDLSALAPASCFDGLPSVALHFAVEAKSPPIHSSHSVVPLPPNQTLDAIPPSASLPSPVHASRERGESSQSPYSSPARLTRGQLAPASWGKV